jgi:hypothetical protein
MSYGSDYGELLRSALGGVSGGGYKKKTLQVWIQLQDNKQWLSLGGQTNNARNV